MRKCMPLFQNVKRKLDWSDCDRPVQSIGYSRAGEGFDGKR
jgi:hypothetical protein